MAKTPEKKVKDQVTKLLDAKNAYWFYPVMGGYGSSGVPDIVACYRGVFIGIECKAGNNTPTALQIKNLNQISQAGGYSAVINETNLDELQVIFNRIDSERKTSSQD
jgi:Holliday junction resolvase